MSAQRLYKAEWVCDEFGNLNTDDLDWDSRDQAPVGWREYALERWPDGPREHEAWPFDFKPFFWPNTDRIFRSRSAAQRRVDIINRWGGRAVLVECTPHWETVSAANARRKRAQLEAQKVRLYEKVYDIDEAIQATRIAEASA